MPYNLDNLPEQIKKLPKGAQKIFVATFNNALEKYGEESARKIAWSAVKIKYEKELKTDEWNKKEDKSDYTYLSMYITKAVTNDKGEMNWFGTASDIGLDLFEDRTSIDLFKSFIENLDGNEYVSLSHYPDLNGKAELGKITHLFIDGDKLKAKGNFHDNELGKRAFNAIRKDRRDNVEQNNRIRISIGFLDRKHIHVDKGGWDAKEDRPCMLCMRKTKGKIFLEGKLIHAALTRIPARVTTEINVEEQ